MENDFRLFKGRPSTNDFGVDLIYVIFKISNLIATYKAK